MELLTVIFIGRSGCGKGTQIDKLSSYLSKKDDRKIFHLEAGQKFRSFISGNTYSANLAKQINDYGGLQPEFLSIWAWTGEIIDNLDKNQHFFIDGTPRRLSESKILESVFTFFSRKKVSIVYLNVSRDWSISRMQNRNRNDDREMSDIIARLDWFDSDVVPVVEYYRTQKTHDFFEINGEQSIDEVHNDILKKLKI